jgi:Na+-driven multidrug efflux pump
MPPTPPQRPPGVLRLAWPLVLSFWLRSAFQWVDTIYASTLPGLGDASIAAIGLTAPFEFLMIACWVGSSNGLTSRLAAAMGARQGAKIEQLLDSTRRILRWLRGIFIALAAGIWIAAPWLPLADDVAAQFRIYGSVLLGGSAFTAFWSVLPDSLVKAHNDTRSTMWAGLASTLTNFALNTLFVFAFHWGIFGIALATVLARLAGLAYALRKARAHEARRLASGSDTDPALFTRPTRAILALSVPAGLGFALLAFEGLAINAMLAAREGSAAILAAWSIIDRTGRFLTMPVIAVGVALLPLCARMWGARDFDGIRRSVRVSLLASAVYSAVFALPLTLLLGSWVAESLTDAPPAQAAARRGLALIGLAVFAGGPTFLLRSAFDGMQHPRPGLVAGVLRALFLIVPLSALGLWLAPRLGLAEIEGLVLGFSAGAGVATALLLRWMRTFLREECPAGP